MKLRFQRKHIIIIAGAVLVLFIGTLYKAYDVSENIGDSDDEDEE